MSSATRALRILEELVSAERPPGRGELLRALDMPSSTLSTLLAELRGLGYVGTVDRRYVPGPGLVALGFHVTQRSGPARWLAMGMHPILERLAAATGETVTLSIEVGRTPSAPGSILAVDHVVSPNPVRYVPGIGQLQPIHRAAAGRVFLALTHRSARDISPDALVKTTPNTVVDPDRLDAILDLVRRRGYALNRDETIEGVTAIAAPVIVGNAPVAAITVLGPSQRLLEAEQRIWPILRDEIAALAEGDVDWLGGAAASVVPLDAATPG